MADVLLGLVRLHLAVSVAILVLLVLRKPAQRIFGAEAAYGLWLVAPLAAAASLGPAPTVLEGTPLTAAQAAAQALKSWMETSGLADQAGLLIGVWLAGVAAALALMARAQMAFQRKVAAGQAGPALMGAIYPRFVTPADYRTRFTEDERKLVREHEQTHRVRKDPQANALLALAQALAWFNPLVHLAAAVIRFDQELACDASVVRRFPSARRRYAEAMLKTQLSGPAAPLTCNWPAASLHPLEVRVALLKRAPPSDDRVVAGAVCLVGLAFAAAITAWSVQPQLAQPTMQLLVLEDQRPVSVMIIHRRPEARDL